MGLAKRLVEREFLPLSQNKVYFRGTRIRPDCFFNPHFCAPFPGRTEEDR